MNSDLDISPVPRESDWANGRLIWAGILALGLMCWLSPARNAVPLNVKTICALSCLGAGYALLAKVAVANAPLLSRRPIIAFATIAGAITAPVVLGGADGVLGGMLLGVLPVTMSVAYTDLFDRQRSTSILNIVAAAVIPLMMFPLGIYLTLIIIAVFTGDGP